MVMSTKVFYILILLILYLLWPFLSFSQYVIKKFEKNDGLPQNSVNSLLQSKDGYLWLGTQNGLVRFDGLNFTIFDKNNTKGIISDHILSVLESKKEGLWIGTFGGGLLFFKNDVVKSFYKIFPIEIIRCLFEDKDGSLWIGTEGKGLWRLEKYGFKNYQLRSDIENITIRAILKDSRGNLWVGTENFGLFKLEKGRIKNINENNGLPDNNVYCILEDHFGQIWIGTGNGLVKFFEDKWRIFKKKDGLEDNFIRCLFQDKSGILWIGTNSGGLNYFKDGGFLSISLKDGLSHNSIASICEDKEGNLWIGTNGGGLNQLKKGKVRMLTQKEGLKNELVWTILKGKDEEIWIGTSGRLFCYKNGKIFNYPNLNNKTIWSLFYGKNETLWVGTSGDGLIKIKNKNITIYNTKDGLANNVISAIQEDEEGRLFIGTRGGLSILESEKFYNYSIKDGLASDVIYALLYDKNKILWVGTREGLCKMEKGKFHSFKIREEFGSNVIISIFEDKDTLWLGTYGGGLIHFKDGKFFVFKKKDGLFDDAIFQILEDDLGNFWMSSNSGIFSISKKVLEDFEKGKIKKISCRPLGISDGLLISECNGGSQPAGFVNNDGKLWFPTIKGVAVVNPYEFSINNVIPPVIIEKLKIDDLYVDLNQGKKFGPSKGKLEIQYTALSFIAPEKVLFKYKLEGFDDKWIEAGGRRVAYYTNIPPGKYTFKVIACNNDGIWNQKGASFDFELKPHFYETFWFRFFLLIFFILSLFLTFLFIHKVRLKILEAESKVLTERNKIAQEIHDTIAQSLQGLSILLQQIEKKVKKENLEIVQDINKAYILTREALQEVRYSISALKLSFKQIWLFPEFLKTKILPLFSESKANFIFEVFGKPFQLTPIEEYNLMRIVQEAVRNSLKHSMAKNIKIILKYEELKFFVSIIDDGIGFNLDKINASEMSGFGIDGMKERAKQIGAELLIKSEINKGTSVEVFLNFKSKKRKSYDKL